MEPLYQSSFFTVNRQLSKLKELADIHPKVMNVSFVGYNTWNRCINFFDVLTDRERLKAKKAPVMIEFLFDIGRRSPQFLEKLLDDFCNVFPEYLFRESISFIQNLKYKSPATVDLESFVYHLLVLYHHFPRHPELMFDGCVFRVLPRINGHYPKWTHAKLDPVYDSRANLDYTYYPWSKLELYDGWSRVDTLFLDQENNRGLKEHPGEPVLPTNFVDLYFERSKLIFCYLDPFLMDLPNSDGTEFDGRSFYSFSKDSKTDGKDAFSFLVLPLYDEGLPDRPCGRALGNVYYLFKNQDDRDDFLKKDFGLSKVNASLLIGEVGRSRNERLLNTRILQPDPLYDLIEKLLIVQDWEKILVFTVENQEPTVDFWVYRNSGINHKQYTLKELVEPENYEDRPQITDKTLSKTVPEHIKALKNDLHKEIIGCRNSSAVVLEDIETREKSCFFLVHMQSLLSTKILPNLSSEKAVLYRDRVLCFQFPETILLPDPAGDAAAVNAGIQVLGNRYLDRILPIFNGLLLKHKVQNQSVKSAVSAIMARNHSHHIGSHVTPRTSIEKCRARLRTLEGKNKRPEAEEDIIAALKLRLDEYIQQKADFTAEIATEPIISTKKSGFFNQVMAKFIQNTLLMDNLGANEGVNYAPATDKKSQSRNRLNIHFYKDGKETQAIFGDPKEKFGEVPQAAYPYPGVSFNGRQLILKKPAQDYDVALPGPMGEFAFYSFLENFIRNAIKHNINILQANGNKVNIHINLCQIPENDAGHLHFLKCEIWDDLTPADAGLIEKLRQIKDDFLVDREGTLVKGGWGVAEMKIMATLLCGSTRFLDMSQNLTIKPDKKDGKSVLVYEFNLMKPREAAIVSSAVPKHKTNHEKQGIFWFDSIEDYKNTNVSAPTHFNFILIDDVPGMSAADIEKNLHLFPGRVLVHEKYGSRIPGTAVFNQDSMEMIRSSKQTDQILQFMWQCRLNQMQARHGYVNPRISVFFEQKEDETPTRLWKQKLSEFDKQGYASLAASVIYKTAGGNALYPEPESGTQNETHFIFDRHGGGYRPLKEQNIVFHELFDKNSADFVPVFSTPEDRFFFQINHLAEAAFTRILILDERVAELAFDSIVPTGNEQKRTKEEEIYGSTLRIYVAKYSGIFIATHLNLNGTGPRPITPKIDSDEDKGYCVSMDISKNENQIDVLKINRMEDPGKSAGKFDVAIIHQGVLEAFFKPHIDQGKSASFVEHTANFIFSLKQHIPSVVIDSGRGIPANLPQNIKFLPFSLMEGFLMKDKIAKLSLTKVLMSLTRRSGR